MKTTRGPRGLIVAGALLVASYWILTLLGVGKIGDDADIGGGLILVAGYVMVGSGIAALAVAVIRERRRRSG